MTIEPPEPPNPPELCSERVEEVCKPLVEYFKECLSELLQSYVDIKVISEDGHADDKSADMTSIVGLSSPEISVSVAFKMSSETAFAIAEGLFDDEVDCADWLGELGNQLGGRLKNKMACYGLSPTLSTPVVVSGIGLALSSTATRTYETNASFGEYSCEAQLTYSCQEGFELESMKAQESIDDIMEEGCLAFF